MGTMKYAPAADDCALWSTNGNVVADDEEAHTILPVRVYSGKLLPRETEVEDVAGVVLHDDQRSTRRKQCD